jgi:DNA-binding NarL/FixJ family response regulator
MNMRGRGRIGIAKLQTMSEQSEGPVRVVAVEDDARFRASLEVLFRHTPDFELVGSYAMPAAALAALDATRRDAGPPWGLVLMDLDLPGMTGIECTRRIKTELGDVRVVVLTVFEDRDSIVEAICAGADGYLLKRTPSDELLAQLRSVMAGGSPLSGGVARTVLELVRRVNTAGDAASAPHSLPVELTPRERDVLNCLVQGMSYKAVSASLDVSIDTVRTHIRAVYRKLQVNSVAEAVGRALREKLV